MTVEVAVEEAPLDGVDLEVAEGVDLLIVDVALLQGALADVWGPQATVVASGTCLLIFALYLASKPDVLANLDRDDDTPNRPER